MMRKRNLKAFPLLGKENFDPPALLERKEQMDLIRQWISELPPMQRTAIVKMLEIAPGHSHERTTPAEYINRSRGLKRLRHNALLVENERKHRLVG